MSMLSFALNIKKSGELEWDRRTDLGRVRETTRALLIIIKDFVYYHDNS